MNDPIYSPEQRHAVDLCMSILLKQSGTGPFSFLGDTVKKKEVFKDVCVEVEGVSMLKKAIHHAQIKEKTDLSHSAKESLD